MSSDVDFLEHLTVLKKAFEDHIAETHVQNEKEEGSCGRFDRTLLSLLEAEDKFVRERGIGDIAFPGVVSSATGFPSLPSFKRDMEVVAKEDEKIREIMEGRVIAESCPHCLYNVELGQSVRFVPVVTLEEVRMREEGSRLTVSLVHRIERTSGVDTLVRCGKHPEVADGLEKILITCRYRWAWTGEEQQGRLEIEVEA